MKTELVNTFGNVFVTISPDHDNQWICATWHGYSTEDAVQRGMEAYTEALEAAEYNAVLVDTRGMIGSWSHTLEWALEEWSPKAGAAGLKYYALVAKSETFAESTADDFYTQVQSFKADVFQDMATARAWLRKQRLWNNTKSFVIV